MARKPHVLVVPLATRGHVNPMMHFSKILAAQGVAITFVNTEFNAKLVVESQSDSELQKAGLDIRFVELPDGLPPGHGRTTDVIEMCEVIMSTMGEPFEKLVESLLLKDPPITCILADTWLVFALDAARKFGLPHANFWTQSATSLVSILSVVEGYRPPADPEIPGALFLKPSDMNTFVQCYDPSNFMFRFVTGGFDRLSESASILINTFDELEHETIEAVRRKLPAISAVGPLLPAAFLQGAAEQEPRTLATLWEEEERCIKWLDERHEGSVLYVSFGSLAIVSSEEMEEVARGLEGSGRPFLWVVRPDMVLGDGGHAVPDGFKERVRGVGEVVRWAPQLRVLAHRAIGGFFTHGGWNSTLEGLAAGVPMLGWPYFSDQPMDCECIEKGWHVGLRLTAREDTGIVCRSDVAAKINAIMDSPHLRTNALRWKLAAQKATLGSSSSALHSFVLSLPSLPPCPPHPPKA